MKPTSRRSTPPSRTNKQILIGRGIHLTDNVFLVATNSLARFRNAKLETIAHLSARAHLAEGSPFISFFSSNTGLFGSLVVVVAVAVLAFGDLDKFVVAVVVGVVSGVKLAFGSSLTKALNWATVI